MVQHKEKNKMSAENVGIVFGPTLLREANDQTIMDNLYLLQYQKKVVEIMVENPDILFEKWSSGLGLWGQGLTSCAVSKVNREVVLNWGRT